MKFPLFSCFFLITSFFLSPVFAQTSCTTCSATNCSSVSVSYTINGVPTNCKSIPWIQGMNVRVAMINMENICGWAYESSPSCPYGGYVTSINGLKAASGSYWELYINGSSASLGLDFQQLSANDAVNWVLTSYNVINNQLSANKSMTEDRKPLSHQLRMAHQHHDKIVHAVKPKAKPKK